MARPKEKKVAEERVAPTAELTERRRLWANGRDPNQTSDTIGKLWARNLLVSERHAPDLLRDAGRSYAAAYWIHYQKTAAARIGGYQEMIGGGIAPLHIPDPLRDVIAHERFRRMDAELGGPTSGERNAIRRYCIDQQGDHIPAWLEDRIVGFEASIEVLRNKYNTLSLFGYAYTGDARKLHRAKMRAVEAEIEERRRRFEILMATGGPDIPALNRGLNWIADWIEREKSKRRPVAN